MQIVTSGDQRAYEKASTEKCQDLGYSLKVEFSSSADGLDMGCAINQEINDESKVIVLSQKFNRLYEFEF